MICLSAISSGPTGRSLSLAHQRLGVCALRGLSAAVAPAPGSSPGGAAGSPGRRVPPRGAAPSRGCCSAASSPPPRRGSSSRLRYRPGSRCCHLLRRCCCCSSRNDRSRNGTATGSWGGPWRGRAGAAGTRAEGGGRTGSY